MTGAHARTALLLGGDVARLRAARVLVVGTGGVGSWAAEVLARSGVGALVLVDPDVVEASDLNRQLPALTSTLGRPKVDVLAERLRQAAPTCQITAVRGVWREGPHASLLDPRPDAILDCIDTVTDKVHLLHTAVTSGIPVFSAMGAGGRLDPTRVRVSDLAHTRVDRLARVVRDLLRKRGVRRGVVCVWSDEDPHGLHGDDLYADDGHYVAQGSVSWVPAQLGATLAGVACARLLGRPVWGLDDEVGRHRARSGRSPDRMAPIRKPSRDRKRELLESVGLGRPERSPEDP